MKFLGYEVNGYVVAASCPATECIENVVKCAENGAQAVILKSASSSRTNDGKKRRCYIDYEKKQFWSESGFDREMLLIDEAVELTKSAKLRTGILIIPSVCELTYDTKQWVETCKRLENAGADALQLDFFYFNDMLCEDGLKEKMITLLKAVMNELSIPIMPKVNHNLPASYIAKIFREAGVKYVSLLDSVRSVLPNNPIFEGKSLSVFGEWMFPLTKQYTKILVDSGFEVCAGGGVTNGSMAAELVELGASTVQIAMEILLNGYARFSEIEKECKQCMQKMDRHRNSHFIENRKASVNLSKCTGCGRCKVQCFCNVAKDLVNDNTQCEGCGLCADICKSGAITI
ncbi:MAG: 4Fe-4S binding protein [Lachnospiraceae bacterium]|nr:4Fe-4S binding protein [Lachnospiraceae bacterium]